MACRLCYILVLCLALPAFTLAQAAAKDNGTTLCDKPEVKTAGDKVFNVFNDLVKRNGDGNSTSIGLRAPINDYVKVANESCYNDTRSGTRDSTEFTKLVDFAIRHGLYKSFVENGGVACINAAKRKISACVKAEVGNLGGTNKTQNRKYDNLWKMTYLTFDMRSCKATHKTKGCTLKAMHEQGPTCKPENNLYVSSLFDYMLERCEEQAPDWRGERHLPVPPPKGDIKGTRTTHALLAVLLVFAIMAMFYVCVRDCRAPRGPWKALNERISMSMVNRQRRRSLVNNEVRSEP